MHSTESSSGSDALDIKCCSCFRAIHSSDWIRQAKQNVYHLACFSCNVCKRQLSTGEEFALLEERLLCKLHYVEQLDLPASLSENHNNVIHHVSNTQHTEVMSPPDLSDNNWNKPGNKNKRMRTSFSEEQVQVLQANFEIDANPDSSELERIASDVCLPKRVTQVWFQNSRARQKKQQQQAKMHGIDH